MLRDLSRRIGREHLLAYALASACDLILLVPQSQLAMRAGQQLEVALPIILHQLIIGMLVVLLSISGALRTRRWQYTTVGILFAAYVGFRMATRFVASLELISLLAGQGVPDNGAVPSLYFYGLAAAAAYTGMILTLRRSYGKLTFSRNSAEIFH